MYLIAGFVALWTALVLGAAMIVRALPPPGHDSALSASTNRLIMEIRAILGVLTFLIAGILAFALTAGIIWLTGGHGPV